MRVGFRRATVRFAAVRNVSVALYEMIRLVTSRRESYHSELRAISRRQSGAH